MTRLQLRHRCGFSLIEVLAVLCIFGILLTIFIPYFMRQRETANRIRCADNLRQIRSALQSYAQDNGYYLPRVRHGEANGEASHGYIAYTGPDDPDPFAVDSAVSPNDVTASLWLLVRRNLINDSSVFLCPSRGGRRDALVDARGATVSPAMRGNFRSPRNLSYSYASPFSAALGYRLSFDWLKPQFAILSDRSPGIRRSGDDAAGPKVDDPPRRLALGNSRNHGKAGQNVLFADGHVSFQATPYCGVEQDNIFTALWPRPLERGHSPPASGQGFIGRRVGASWNGDSYLVPTDDDEAFMALLHVAAAAQSTPRGTPDPTAAEPIAATALPAAATQSSGSPAPAVVQTLGEPPPPAK